LQITFWLLEAKQVFNVRVSISVAKSYFN